MISCLPQHWHLHVLSADNRIPLDHLSLQFQDQSPKGSKCIIKKIFHPTEHIEVWRLTLKESCILTASLSRSYAQLTSSKICLVIRQLTLTNLGYFASLNCVGGGGWHAKMPPPPKNQQIKNLIKNKSKINNK